MLIKIWGNKEAFGKKSIISDRLSYIFKETSRGLFDAFDLRLFKYNVMIKFRTKDDFHKNCNKYKF